MRFGIVISFRFYGTVFEPKINLAEPLPLSGETVVSGSSFITLSRALPEGELIGIRHSNPVVVPNQLWRSVTVHPASWSIPSTSFANPMASWSPDEAEKSKPTLDPANGLSRAIYTFRFWGSMCRQASLASVFAKRRDAESIRAFSASDLFDKLSVSAATASAAAFAFDDCNIAVPESVTALLAFPAAVRAVSPSASITLPERIFVRTNAMSEMTSATISTVVDHRSSIF